MEPGVQTPRGDAGLGSGSCRDSAWLLVQMLRHLGLAARFVSGYLIQLRPDVKPLDGPAGPAAISPTCTPGPKSICPEPAGSGSIRRRDCWRAKATLPLAATPDPLSAAPISGLVEPCRDRIRLSTCRSTRIVEDPRVTKPYTEDAMAGKSKRWAAGRRRIGRRRRAADHGRRADVRLHRRHGRRRVEHRPRWVPTKRRLAGELLRRLAGRFAHGPLLHFGQGKWYPGESLPRWALGCYWRKDGEPIWSDPALIADDEAATIGRTRPGPSSPPWRGVAAGRRPRHPGLRRRLVLPLEGAASAGQRRPAAIESGRSRGARTGWPGCSIRVWARWWATRCPCGRVRRGRTPVGERRVVLSAGTHVSDSRRLADGFPAAAGFDRLDRGGRPRATVIQRDPMEPRGPLEQRALNGDGRPAQTVRRRAAAPWSPRARRS